ncbi:MAG: hypothetical protein NC340_10425 [Ruminococcus flavefaciens]|nr:hypothetical protein [Ruminococcus flavefaciens]MCM1230978.1 hypothetical protein [Ruminococcus flavefaciens]
MDMIIITVAVILAVIALIEIIALFSFPTDNAPPYVTVLPVFADDRNFQQRLEYILQKGCGRTNIIIVNYSANDSQLELCRQFVEDNPDAVFISCTELQKYFAETFAI